MPKRRSRSNDGQLERALKVALMLARGQTVTTRLLREKFGVSHATAKRDMLRIEHALGLVLERGSDGSAMLRLQGFDRS